MTISFPDGEVAAIEQARVEELEKQPPIAGHCREEHQRWCATHDGVDRLLHVGLQRRGRRRDTGAMIFIARHAPAV
jgi:hypothetical protein